MTAHMMHDIRGGAGGRLFHALMHKGGGGGCFPYFMVFSESFSILTGEIAQRKAKHDTCKAQQNKACKAQGVWFSVLWSLPYLFAYFVQINNKA